MKLTAFAPAEIAPAEQLVKAEKFYRRASSKLRFMLWVPALWLVALIPALVVNTEDLWEYFAAWCMLTFFGFGAYVVLKFPALEDAVNQYTMLVLPGLFKKNGATKVKASIRHTVSQNLILETGLYHDKYNAMSREYAVQGEIEGADFGMYETAMQVMESRGARYTRTAYRTNHFYGWFIITEIRAVPGFHFITLRRRLSNSEADDWHAKTLSHWENDAQLQRVQVNSGKFDDLFLLNSDQPGKLRELLTPSVREFLLYLAETSKNSFAISIQRSRIFMLIGHDTAGFRQCPEKNFREEFHPELVQDVKWYADLVRGLSRIGLR